MLRKWYAVMFLIVGLFVAMSFVKVQPAFALPASPPWNGRFLGIV